MILTVQQCLTVMLAVDVDQQSGRLFERTHAHGLAVDPADAAPFHQAPAQRDHALFGPDLHFRKPADDPFIVKGKCQLDQSAVRAVPQHVRRVPSAEGEIYRSHKDGFPGAGLAGQDIKPGSEIHF